MNQNKFDLFIDPPIMNAAGILGYAPGKHGGHFGVFVTNPISLFPRKPANSTRYISYPGGFLLHTGMPNLGIKQVIRKYARSWAAAQIPIIVHLLAQNRAEILELIAHLEDLEGIAGVEIGLHPSADSTITHRMATAARGEFALIVRLPFDAPLSTVQAAVDSGADMVSMAAPRGILPDTQGTIIAGRLYGPAIFPLALHRIQQWKHITGSIIAAGGIYHPRDVQTMLTAGAGAVQIGPALWKNNIFFEE